jgi:hypothetical protein
MRQLAVALRSIQRNGALPPAAITDPRTGKPLLSWRVAVLPRLGQDALFREFKLDEAWDSPHNRRLLERMPDVFAAPDTSARQGVTRYQVFIGPGTAFELRPDGNGRGLREFTDGTGATILIVEAAMPVEWSKPADLVYDPRGPLPPLGGLLPKTFHLVLADGTCQLIRRDLPETTLRALITRDGGEALPPDWDAGDESDGALRGFGRDLGNVSGRLTVEGAPCPGGVVRLHQLGNPTEVVRQERAEVDGTYHIYGVALGAYPVSVTGPPEGKVPVPVRFADPATSGLEVKVQPQKQTFDITVGDSNEKGGPGKPR